MFLNSGKPSPPPPRPLVPVVHPLAVPEFRQGLRKFVQGLKILEGRCVNAQEAMELGVAPGSLPLLEEDIAKARILMTEGLSMLEGTNNVYA